MTTTDTFSRYGDIYDAFGEEIADAVDRQLTGQQPAGGWFLPGTDSCWSFHSVGPGHTIRCNVHTAEHGTFTVTVTTDGRPFHLSQLTTRLRRAARH